MRVLIVDDDASFRKRVRELIASEPDMDIVGEAADGQEAIFKAKALVPDLVLMDVRMPQMNGIEAAHKLNSDMPKLKIIILTVFDMPEYREAATACGANGFVIKKSLLEDLMPAIRQAIVDA